MSTISDTDEAVYTLTTLGQEAGGLAPPDTDDVEPEPEPITDQGRAAWAMRKLARIRALEAEAQETADAELDRIHRWFGETRLALAGQASWYEAQLVSWHRAVLADDSARKTITLPHGTLRARRQSDRWDFDEDEFVAWAEAHRPELLRSRTVVTIDRAAARRALRPEPNRPGTVFEHETGEWVPAVTVTPGEVTFSVTVTP